LLVKTKIFNLNLQPINPMEQQGWPGEILRNTPKQTIKWTWKIHVSKKIKPKIHKNENSISLIKLQIDPIGNIFYCYIH